MVVQDSMNDDDEIANPSLQVVVITCTLGASATY
jgi:hypothetical protein